MKKTERMIYALALAAAMSPWVTAEASEVYNFNPGWLLHIGDSSGAENPSFNDSDWKKVTLPRAFNEDEAYKIPIAQLTDTVAWYRKHFKVPSSAKGKKVFIEFEGARQGADVYVNGEHVGLNENGVMAFGFDITPYVKPGKENVVAVRTDNNWRYHERSSGSVYQWNDKNFNANYGGLPKNVRLHITGEVYQTLPLYSSLGTTGVYVYAKDIDIKKRSAKVYVESEVKNDSKKAAKVSLDVEITDADGKVVATYSSPSATVQPGGMTVLKASKPLGDLHFWSWGYGYLYNVKTTLVVDGKKGDTVDTRTGFRKTEFKDGQFKLNDRTMMVHGYAQRTSNEWPGVGMSVPAWLSDYSNLEMVRSGGNVVRWMHVAPWKQDVESCDRVGLIQAMPAGDSERDVTGRRWEHRTEVMRDAIIYNRNNPSIIFYEGGNKGISDEHMQALKAIRDKYDPHGGRAAGSREMLASKVSEYGGEMLYINKSAGQPVWAMEYSRDEGLRRYWDDWSFPYHKSGDGPLYRNADASDYNRNQDQLAVEHVRRWHDYWQERPGMGDRVSSGGVKIIFSDTQTHCRGESNYRTSGVSDAMRLPKDSYYAHQVMWDGWVTPEKSRTYIMGHWNYDKGTVKPVYVVSDAPRVELLLNGKPVGREKVDYHFLHTFDSIAYEPGTLKAVSLDEKGNTLSEYTLTTAGAPARLNMTVMTAPGGLVADGADMALIEYEVVDSEGRRCPLDNRNVSFRVEGPAEWRGGIAKGADNMAFSTTLPVECGVNRVFVRSLDKPGVIKVYAQAEGLPEEKIELKSKAVKVKDGLTTYEQRATLPLSLERGETPATPSYKDLKKTVRVASVTAGCNQELAAASVDDNESSEWRNDGSLKNAWIKYSFAEPTVVDELDIKLTGWRRRSYPIEITADNGEMVWEGNTPTSLGYCNLKLKPVKTGSLTIRLKGSATESEGFGQITELVAPVANDLDLFKAEGGDKVNNELRIIEADFLKVL